MNKLIYIDVLRGLAIIGVVLFHAGEFGNNDLLPSVIKKSHLSGAIGVQLFYIVSAFTLFNSLSNRSISDNRPILSFYIRRFFRIAPLYYLAIIYYLWQTTLISEPLYVHSSFITPLNIISNTLFLHGFSPFWINSIVQGGWSLAIESTFYLIMPLLFQKIKSTKSAFNFLVLSLLFRFVLIFILNKISNNYPEEIWNNYLYFFFPNQLPIFALGILFYYIIKENYCIKIDKIALFIFTLLLSIQFSTNYIFITNLYFWGGVILLLGIWISQINIPPILINSIAKVGKLSFSIYLTHFAIIFWLKHYNLIDIFSLNTKFGATLNYASRFSLILVGSLILSQFTFKLIEQPFQKIGKLIINNS